MNTKTPITIGTIIKQERLENQLTQKDLAQIACITTKTLSDIENNLIDPRFSTIKGLCKILGIVINFKTFEE